MIDLMTDPLVQRMLLVALMVGATAPIVGTYLVHRRMSLLGDGIGHVALAGVAAGWLAGSWADLAQVDTLAIPGAILFAVAGAVVIERMRARGVAAADVIMAIMFYGGIASGVLLISVAGGSNANLMGYLFGSISTASWADVWVTVGLSALILVIGLGLRSALFAVTHDQEFAYSTGLPVAVLNMLVAVLAAYHRDRSDACGRCAARERPHDPAGGDRPGSSRGRSRAPWRSPWASASPCASPAWASRCSTTSSPAHSSWYSASSCTSWSPQAPASSNAAATAATRPDS
ncbi:hypothetical protein GCM10025876_03870 [Demequina litorisediminis]|uniref:Zinc transport system permease protein n=1 Tax=Demequina litorisediminis TaxID=1849022 RepID=A0ABQ6IAT2_9MICO|nr:hypothetical protein GCM10025876_03870 [Demequina litorisediminis]